MYRLKSATLIVFAGTISNPQAGAPVLPQTSSMPTNAEIAHTDRGTPKEGSYQQHAARTQALLAVDTDREAVYGNRQALINVISYFDFTCAYCRKLRPAIKKLVNDSNGQINWVFRQFPLSETADGGQLEAQAVECTRSHAGSEQFWAYVSRLYYLPRRAGSGGRQLAQRAAMAGNIDWTTVETCIDAGTVVGKIRRQQARANELGVNAAPTLFLVHRASGRFRRVEGAVSFGRLKREIGALLRSAGN